MTHHPDKAKLDALFGHIRDYQKLATAHGIADIFQDNGGKLLQMLLALGLRISPGREGNDAIDEQGNEYELKTVNTLLTKQFSTHHHLNPTILSKYRKVDWFFGVYEGIELIEIWRATPSQLEPFFSKWEQKWNQSQRDINNPKIPLSFVRKVAKLVHEEKSQLVYPLFPANPPMVAEAEEGEE